MRLALSTAWANGEPPVKPLFIATAFAFVLAFAVSQASSGGVEVSLSDAVDLPPLHMND